MASKIFATDVIDPARLAHNKYRVYKTRWALLLSAVLVNFSYGMLSTSFNWTSSALPDSESVVSENSQLIQLKFWFWCAYPLGFLVFVFPASLLIVKCGILPSLYISIGLGLLGLVVRFCAVFIHSLENCRYAIILLSHTIHAISHAIPLLLTTAISHYWFPAGQRSMVTSTIVLAFVLGHFSSSLLPAHIAFSTTNRALLSLTYLNGCVAVLPLMPLLLVWRSRPDAPPSAGADPFIISRRTTTPRLSPFAMANNTFIFGLTAGTTRFVFDLHEALVCADETMHKFRAFNVMLFMAAAGIGAFVMSAVVDSTQGHKTVFRASLAAFSLASCLLAWADVSVSRAFLTLGALGLMAFFACGLLAIGLEMSVEMLFEREPVYSASLTLSTTYVVYLCFIIVSKAMTAKFPVVSTPEDGEIQCNSKIAKPYTMQLATTIALLAVFMIMIVSMRWIPRRRLVEEATNDCRINDVLYTNALGSEEVRTQF